MTRRICSASSAFRNGFISQIQSSASAEFGLRIVVAGDQQNREVRNSFSSGASQAGPADPRHRVVRDEQIAGRRRWIVKQGKRQATRRCLGNAATEFRQLRRKHLPNLVVIVNQQHVHGERSVAPCARPGRRRGSIRSWFGVCAGQVYSHARTMPDLADDFDGTAALGGDAVNDRKAEPRTSADFLCRKEWLEALGQYLRRHSAPGVGHRQEDIISGRHPCGTLRVASGDIRRLDGDSTAS